MTDSPQGNDEAHDILAAEEFAIPGREPGVPRDPDPRPHDILAAEEFAMPAPGDGPGGRSGGGSLAWAVVAAGAALALFARLRGRRRRPRRR
jgi:hypothetical protein